MRQKQRQKWRDKDRQTETSFSALIITAEQELPMGCKGQMEFDGHKNSDSVL